MGRRPEVGLDVARSQHEMWEAKLFGIRFFTPQALGSDLQPIAGGVLRVGDTLLRFPVDLSYWSKANYEHHWHEAIQLLARGAQRSALVYAYRGPTVDATHLMWAMWRDDQYVYVQDQAVLASELDGPFDPALAYVHVGERLTPASGAGITEWRFEIEHLLAAAFGMRSPG